MSFSFYIENNDWFYISTVFSKLPDILSRRQLLQYQQFWSLIVESVHLREQYNWLTDFNCRGLFYAKRLDNRVQKSQNYRWRYKFQATGSENNFSKKAENSRSGRKLTTSCPDNMDAVRDSIGRCLKKSLQRPSQDSFTRIVAKNLKEGSSTISIQNPDQVQTHISWHRKTFSTVARKQDWKGSWLPW